MIKAFVFDIDNTLYSYDTAHKTAFQAVTDYVCPAFGLAPDEFAALHRQGDRLLRQRVGSVTAAIHNRLIRYQIILEELGQPIRHAPVMASLYWSTFLAAMEPGPGLQECLDSLKAQGFTLGVGTNMTAEYQYAKLEKLGILDAVDFMVSSEEAGAEKPERRLFDFCAGKAGCTPGECVFVGDSLEFDARGSLAAGMIPVWLCPEDRPCEPPIRRIASLAELPGLAAALSPSGKESAQ